MDHLEALRRVQESDLQLSRLRKRIEEARHSPDASETGLSKLKLLLERARGAHLEARKNLQLKEGEVAALVARRKPQEEKLQRALTPKSAEAAQKELSLLAERIAALEEEVLACMEAEDEAARMLAQTEDALERLGRKHAGEVGARPVKIREIEEEMARIEKERQVFRDRADEADLKRYDSLAERFRDRAVVEVEESCPGCDASFTDGQVQELLRNRSRVQNCPSCGRLVIFVGVERL